MTHCSRQLDELEARLSRQRYLVGRQMTEADWRLFPTLGRFDVAYFPLFKCNKKRIADYPNLSNYMRDLYRVPGVAATVKPRQYIAGYLSIERLNPTRISRKARRPTMRRRMIARDSPLKGKFTGSEAAIGNFTSCGTN